MTTVEVAKIAFVVWWVMCSAAIIAVSLALKASRWANRRAARKTAARHARPVPVGAGK